MSDTLYIRFRTLLLLGVTLMALALSSTAAFAGEDDDGDDEDDAPVPTQVAPAPVQVKPAPVPAQPAPAAKAPSQPKPSSSTTSHAQTQRNAVPSSAATTSVQGQVVPRGGIQTGAGGTATTFAESGPSPLLLGLGGLLAVLLLGRGVLLARARR